MDITLFYAKIFGVYYLVASLSMLMNTKMVKKMLDSISKNQLLIFALSSFNVILGMALVTTHNLWLSDWTVLITATAWIILLKGIFNMLFPNQMQAMLKDIKPATIQFLSIIMLVLGFTLTYFAFLG